MRLLQEGESASSQQASTPTNASTAPPRVLEEIPVPGLLDTPQSSTSSGNRCARPPQQSHIMKDLFTSHDLFMDYIRNHLKSQAPLALILSGTYTSAARQAVTQVVLAKLIDVYGYSPPATVLSKVADWMADITKLRSTDFFDPKTFKGYLYKGIENRKRPLSAEHKCWVWSKKKTLTTVQHNSDINAVPVSPPALICADLPALDIEGCPRSQAECKTCASK